MEEYVFIVTQESLQDVLMSLSTEARLLNRLQDLKATTVCFYEGSSDESVIEEARELAMEQIPETQRIFILLKKNINGTYVVLRFFVSKWFLALAEPI